MAFEPVAPVISEDLFLAFFGSGVVGVRIGHCQPECAFPVSAAPGAGDPFSGLSEGTEALVVEVIGNAGLSSGVVVLQECGCGGGGEIAESEYEAVGADIGRGERGAGLSEVFELE